ncbi:hypothetical protein IT575_15110 [bacterium]|nr:hypothetical protein [bacterium]
MFLSIRWPLALAACICIALSLCSCDPRYGPGDRPGNLAGCIVQSGSNASLEDFKGRWVLLLPLETSMGYYQGREPELSFANYRPVSPKLDRRKLTVLYVCSSEPCSKLQAAARRLGLQDPLLRVYREAGWSDIERAYEYLIAPSGVVALMEKPGETDWASRLPQFLKQDSGFSPLRLSQASRFSADGKSMDLNFMVGGPLAAGTRCRLELSFDFSKPDEAGVPAVLKTQEFSIAEARSGEHVIPWHFDDLAGCNGATYSLSVLDQRLDVWIHRHGVILAPESFEAGAAKSGANYDSQYRQLLSQ